MRLGGPVTGPPQLWYSGRLLFNDFLYLAYDQFLKAGGFRLANNVQNDLKLVQKHTEVFETLP